AERYANWFTLLPDETKHGMLRPAVLEQVGARRSWQQFESIFAEGKQAGFEGLALRQYCELHSFVPDDLMLKSDKIAMSAGLEGRFPFLDHRLVEFGLAMPSGEKIRRGVLKAPLKALLARRMPRD